MNSWKEVVVFLSLGAICLGSVALGIVSKEQAATYIAGLVAFGMARGIGKTSKRRSKLFPPRKDDE